MNNDKERRRDIKEIINSRDLHVGIILFLIGLLTYMFVVTHLAEGSVSRIVLKLRIKDNHREKIFKKIIGDKNSINDIFSIEKLKVANQNAKQIKIFKYEEDKGIKIAFENPTKGVSGEVLISIRVRTIRDKNTNFYTAYIFDPTYAPSIVLRYSGTPIRDVCPVIYFTSESKGRNSEIDRGQDYIHIKTPNEWVFPTSGVVFVWKVCDLEGALTHGVEV
jgi:hypothetical protein